jgi:DNA-binding protein Fis
MNKIEQIIKGLTLSKSLLLSSIIIGEPYTGKMTLVRSVYPQALYIDAKDKDALKHALSNYQELIIYNFEQIKDLSSLDLENKRVIAIANDVLNTKSIEEHFAFIYYMPPLRERLSEVKNLTKKLSNKIREDLMIETPINIDLNSLDLSQNFKSFKISLYKEVIKKSLNQNDIEDVLYQFFLENLKGSNQYYDLLHIFETPLIKAGLKHYKSQLQLAKVLGLNRNTLRKKIQENGIDKI